VASPSNIQKYQRLLKLSDDTEFIKIEHEDAMVANVYKITQPNRPSLILKICESPFDYRNEVYFLNYFSKQLPVPKFINSVPPSKEISGGVLMEYLSGNLLTPSSITKEIAFEIGASLALIHQNKTHGFGYLNRNLELNSNPIQHFKEKFQEGIEECKNHLPKEIITKSLDYFNEFLHLLKKVDGPRIIHRDFRPGNIIIEENALRGIIDWSSARSSFAEDDFCSIEHGEWGDFNGHKNVFLAGYSSVRKIPNYSTIMTLLRLNRAIAVIGFTVKRSTWDNVHAKVYKFNRQYVDTFDYEIVNTNQRL